MIIYDLICSRPNTRSALSFQAQDVDSVDEVDGPMA